MTTCCPLRIIGIESHVILQIIGMKFRFIVRIISIKSRICQNVIVLLPHVIKKRPLNFECCLIVSIFCIPASALCSKSMYVYTEQQESSVLATINLENEKSSKKMPSHHHCFSTLKRMYLCTSLWFDPNLLSTPSADDKTN